jgi:antitoxin Phd
VRVWPIQEAQTRFNELLDACQSDGPQLITRRGAEAAVLVPVAQWHRLHAASKPSLKELLLGDTARTDLLVPRRGSARRRIAALR